MFDFIKNRNGFSSANMDEMITGYQEMGVLNVNLSEEGIQEDRNDLESYEKYLVESE